MKYKLNDKVEVVEVINGASDSTLNEVGVIIAVDKSDGDYKVELENGPIWWYRDEELELVAPTKHSSDNLYTVIYSHEKILSLDTQVSYLHTTLLPGESKLDMIKREGLENIHFVFNNHLEPVNLSVMLDERTPKHVELTSDSFELGNIVEVVKVTNGAPVRTVGKIGKVIELLSSGYAVTFDDEDLTWCYKYEELERA